MWKQRKNSTATAAKLKAAAKARLRRKEFSNSPKRLMEEESNNNNKVKVDGPHQQPIRQREVFYDPLAWIVFQFPEGKRAEVQRVLEFLYRKKQVLWDNHTKEIKVVSPGSNILEIIRYIINYSFKKDLDQPKGFKLIYPYLPLNEKAKFKKVHSRNDVSYYNALKEKTGRRNKSAVENKKGNTSGRAVSVIDEVSSIKETEKAESLSLKEKTRSSGRPVRSATIPSNRDKFIKKRKELT